MNTAPAKKTGFFPGENRLLAALPEANSRRLLRHMKLVWLPSGRVILEAGATVAHVLFPCSSTVSLTTPLENGDSTGIALIGNDNLIGLSAILEGQRARGPLHRAEVLIAGHAYRMRADCLLQEFERCGALQHVLLRATQAQITQIAQFTVCNRLHSLSKRVCSWLLHSLDRSCGQELYLTQSVLSCVLGVRREGVSEAERHLQSAGVIVSRRGHIHVEDRAALEEQACECYKVIARECARLAPAPGSAARNLWTEPERSRWHREQWMEA